MLSAFLVLGIISMVLAICKLKKIYREKRNSPYSYSLIDSETGVEMWLVFSSIVSVALLVVIGILTSDAIVKPVQIDQEIAMYQEENQKIEASVDAVVANYMEYEENIYSNFDSDNDVTTLLIRFPELSSDELVKKQIEIYQQNNEKIKELRAEEIRLSTEKFLLYFGH